MTTTFGKSAPRSKRQMPIRPMLHLLRIIGPLSTHIFGSNLFLANLDCGGGPIEIMGDAAGLMITQSTAQRSLLQSIATVYKVGAVPPHISFITKMRFSPI